MKKYSRQRELLLSELQNRRDHPTAEELYTAVRMTMPNYSLGTVYRNLGDFVSEGVIVKISMPNGPERYDAVTEPHAHFTCLKCRQLYDIDVPTDAVHEAIQQSTEKLRDEGYCINDYRLLLYGICSCCANKGSDK